MGHTVSDHMDHPVQEIHLHGAAQERPQRVLCQAWVGVDAGAGAPPLAAVRVRVQRVEGGGGRRCPVRGRHRGLVRIHQHVRRSQGRCLNYVRIIFRIYDPLLFLYAYRIEQRIGR